MIINALACIWIYLGIQVKGSWIHKFSLRQTDTNGDLYIAAIYWVVTTLTTVGYGDIKGFTDEEYLFQIGVEFIGIGFFAMCMEYINEAMKKS